MEIEFYCQTLLTTVAKHPLEQWFRLVAWVLPESLFLTMKSIHLFLNPCIVLSRAGFGAHQLVWISKMDP